MLYDKERAQQPPAEKRPPTTSRAPQTPPPVPARHPLEPVTGAADPDRGPGSAKLFPQDGRDELTARLQRAVNTFLDDPRRAVGEAEGVFNAALTHVTDTLTERGRALRTGWKDRDTEAETEELRLVLRQYREITERLLRM
ncbi:hypothetical protein ACQEVX_31335 [Streptomyces syringium]|uniref:hypothetical protein n=1 Tax=Streptomyces syringium TaxID=76729 RepID=UPI003D89BAA5